MDRGELFENGLGRFGPDEGLGGFVVVFDVAGDFGFEFGDGFEDAASDSPAGDGREEALDGVEPGGRCRREMEDPARMIRQPFPDLGMLVGGVVVDDGVDDLAGRDGALDGVEETDEFLMAMLLGMQRPMTVPSRILRAANRVVVPLRL